LLLTFEAGAPDARRRQWTSRHRQCHLIAKHNLCRIEIHSACSFAPSLSTNEVHARPSVRVMKTLLHNTTLKQSDIDSLHGHICVDWAAPSWWPREEPGKR